MANISKLAEKIIRDTDKLKVFKRGTVAHDMALLCAEAGLLYASAAANGEPSNEPSQAISIKAASSVEDGGCMGCTAHAGPGKVYRIWSVSLRSSSFRLCDSCIRALNLQTATIARTPRRNE
jgi:hypothetical protein